jgi:aspartate aminotransferase
MAVSGKMAELVAGGSMIRKMFEAGAQLKAQFGADKVCDFSIGNPDVEPPAAFQKILEEIVHARIPMKHGYMANAGYMETRAAVAAQVSREQGTKVGAERVVMSCGAGGGLNAALKAILNPGDRIVVPSPCFVEYGFYAGNHGGEVVFTPTGKDFDLDIDAIEALVTKDTAAVLVNSPNNPTGRVYSEAAIRDLGRMLAGKSRRTGRTVYLISDEPYRKIVYDGVVVPPIFPHYPHSIVVTSHSKDLSLPGERIGSVAVSPAAEDAQLLTDAIILCTRILGVVNAPALMQRVVARLQGTTVDVEIYRKKRDLLHDALTAMGYKVHKPEGAFYLFPESFGADEMPLVEALREERVLVVPGRGFAGPGHFRIAYCVDTAVIERSLPCFRRVAQRLRGK